MDNSSNNNDKYIKHDNNNDKIKLISKDLEDTKTIMYNNIDLVLNRGEKLEDLNIKAQDLNSHAQTFKTRARQLKKNMCWQNTKLYCIIFVIILCILALIIIASICGTGHCQLNI
jgi:hypothetical protein